MKWLKEKHKKTTQNKPQTTKLAKLVFTLGRCFQNVLYSVACVLNQKVYIVYEKQFIKCSAQYCKRFQALRKVYKMRFDSGCISWKWKPMDTLLYSLLARGDLQKMLCLNFPLRSVAVDTNTYHSCSGLKLARSMFNIQIL